MSPNSSGYMATYMRKRRSLPEWMVIRNQARERDLDQRDVCRGQGHCQLCGLRTDQPEICATCQWEIEVRRPKRRNEVECLS